MILLLLFSHLTYLICLWLLEKVNSWMCEFCSNTVEYEEVSSKQKWLIVGINWRKCVCNHVDWFLWKQANFLNHRLNFLRESRSCQSIFSLDFPRIAPVIVYSSSYCAFPILLLNTSLCDFNVSIIKMRPYKCLIYFNKDLSWKFIG